jgi:hypothetical protein
MILNFIRALLVILLLFVIIVDFDLPIIINTKTNQLFIAIIILLIIIAVDEIIGFLIGLIFLIIYFKFYQKKIMPKSNFENKNEQSSMSSPLASSFSSFASSFTSPFVSSPSFISSESLTNYTNNYTTTANNDPITSFFNFFNGDVKPKSYSTQPEIPDHYIEELKNENCKLIPYISNELLKAAQTNIYNEENYKTEIKSDNNFYGIQGLNSDNNHFAAYDNDTNYHTPLQ